MATVSGFPDRCQETFTDHCFWVHGQWPTRHVLSYTGPWSVWNRSTVT